MVYKHSVSILCTCTLAMHATDTVKQMWQKQSQMWVVLVEIWWYYKHVM